MGEGARHAKTTLPFETRTSPRFLTFPIVMNLHLHVLDSQGVSCEYLSFAGLVAVVY